MRNKNEKLLLKGAEKLGAALTPTQVEMFFLYLQELKKWNQKINLTAIEDDEGIITRHFLDSLIPAKFIKPDASLLDIGAGAGFPGIPLKILMPGLKLVLMDSIDKKVLFMNHVIRTLKLQKAEAIKSRAEDKGTQDKLGKFDYVISRALSELKLVYALSQPYIGVDGHIIAMKGPMDKKLSEELIAIPKEKIQSTEEIQIPHTKVKTTVVLIKP